MYEYLFPFEKIQPGVNIVIYGAGKVGEEFFSQIKQTNYCNITAWVDKRFSEFDDDYLIGIEKIGRVKFDYVVIALYSEEMRDEVKKALLKNRVNEEKIIDKFHESSKIKLEKDLSSFAGKSRKYIEILEKFYYCKQQFGEGRFYQSYDEIGISGQRPTQERLKIYNILKYLKQEFNILDIGCNCGFLDMQLSKYVNSITGIEYNASLVSVGNSMKELVNTENVKFVNQDFKLYNTEDQYDVIFLFSIIGWLNMDCNTLVDKLIRMNSRYGYMLIESHNVEDESRYSLYKNVVDKIKSYNYTVVENGLIYDDKRIRREFVILHRQ